MERRLFYTVFLAALFTAWGAAQTKLLRFPDIHGDTVVFCYAGDLWKAPAKGGDAVRLTAHPGQELFPKFSPDGQWIAFTGQYDGDEQVYVMPSRGGAPRQLTYYPARGPLAPRWGYDNQVYGWTPDGKGILFRSLRDADGLRTESALYVVPLEGGLPKKLPMPTSGAGDFSPDGKRMVYSPLFRDFRTWKRYEGGWAQDLYIFDLDSYAITPVSHSKRTERDPMWIGDRIYFVSDRDGTLNLYRFDIASGETRQLTHEKTWDVRWASSDNRRFIVYELNGELRVYDTETDQTAAPKIFVPNDGLASRPSRYSAAKNIEDFELSPHAKRALFVARGDIFTVPAEKGVTRNLTKSSNAHDKHARWSPDGRKIAFISDRTGEEQVYIVDQDGSGEPEQLTDEFAAMLYAPVWSADSTHLAFSDKDGKLYVLNVADRTVIQVADDEFGGISDYTWSPDGRWLAFSMENANDFRSIYLWSLENRELHRVSDPLYNEGNPAWDPNGKYLYFLSDRQYAPQISLIEWNYAGNRMTGIYAYALQKDAPHLFPPENDEVEIEKQGEKASAKPASRTEQAEESAEPSGEESAKEKKEPKGKGELPAVRIDLDGLSRRVIRVPVEEDNLRGLSATKGYLLYVSQGAPFYGRRPARDAQLNIFDLKERKASVLVEGAGNYALSHDGSKVLVRKNGNFQLYDVRPKPGSPKTISTAGLQVDRIPTQEWAQIFDEVWRRYRDFFYVRNMHGYDWKAIGDRYRALLPYVQHRSDLNYVIGEMIAELNVGHAYIEGGDYEIPERPQVGLPGARFELDEAAGRYRIAHIFQGQNQEPKYRAPLAEVGVDVREGDYVLAIDGEELLGSDNPYRLLQHKTGIVTLTVNSQPTLEGAREVQYTPITSESSLLYLEAVERNRRYVEEKTGGRVGYLHIPDMGASGIYEFIKWFYPQIRKEGLIVDVRSNGGGNVSQWILERLDSKLLGTRFGYASDHPRTYPYTVFHGHKVCLINETSASDGDIFPYYFRKAGLGPLIGKRTWGGVVGISNRGPLIDGGTVYVPLQGTNDENGNWVIEGEGVTPDIEVENDPASVIAGKDPQLDRAIEEVLKMIAEKPMRLPKRPPDPVKTPR
ncbi:MAG: S41 family peptidase [Acidobacteriota bacterium]